MKKKQYVDPLVVLVAGIGGGSHGEQILKALRLAKRKYTVVGCDMDPLSRGSKETDYFYRVPPASYPDYADELLNICKHHNVKAVFHGSESDLMRLATERKRFENGGIYLPINPEPVLQVCQDKIQTARFLKENGFPFPAFEEVTGMEQIEHFNSFPAIAKPSIHGGGSANAFIVQSTEELKAFAAYLLKIYNKFILQEYVGTPDQEYTVGVLSGSDGQLLNSIAVHRIINNRLSTYLKVENRTKRTDLGPTLVISSGVSQGEIGRFESVTGQCETIAKALKPTAPINIQCRLIKGKVYVFEINPRFSGTTSLRAMVGYNEPDILIRRDILGETIESHFPYNEAVIMRGVAETMVKQSPGET